MTTASERIRFPIEVRQYDYGWTVTCFAPDGRVRHVTTADSEIQALRAAHRMVHAYRLSGDILVALSDRRPFRIDVERLMHRTRFEH